MNESVKCPECGSEDVMFSRKRQINICEDCAHNFTVQRSVSHQRIFLSYGHDQNEDLVIQIKLDLEKRGHDVWFDKSKIKSGDQWRRQITDGIMASSHVLFFLSKHSTRDPGVCLEEIGIALGVPGCNIQTILVENETDVKVPARISHIQWLDMQNWQQRKATTDSWDEWYAARFADIIAIVESDEGRKTADEMTTLMAATHAENSDLRISGLLEKPFVGRQWAFDAVDKWQQEISDGSRLFWIVGEPGVGKSTFSAHLTHLFRDRIIAAHFCEWNRPRSKDPRQIIRNLAYQLAARLPDYRKILLNLPRLHDLDGEDAAEIFDYLMVNPLKQAIDGGRQKQIVLVDAIDEASVNNQNPLMDILAHGVDQLPSWLGILVTSRQETEVLAPWQNLAGLQTLELHADGPENQDDIRCYLRQELAAELAASNKNELIDTILTKSEGVFLYVEYICSEIKKKTMSFDSMDELPQGMGGVYARYFRRQFPDVANYKSQTRNVLDAVAAASEPLELNQLAAIFHWNSYDGTEFLTQVGSMFRVVGGRLQSFHKSLFDWLTDETKAGQYFVSTREGHIRLAEAGWCQYLHATTPLNSYFLRCLAFHLGKAGRSDDLVTLLMDISYLERKATEGYTFAIAGEFALALASVSQTHPKRKLLVLLDEALRRDIHFIAQHGEDFSQGLFQCFYNSCWWYDCPDVAVHYELSDATWLKDNEPKLFSILDEWCQPRKMAGINSCWLRSHRPPAVHLGTGQKSVLKGHEDQIESVAVSPDGRVIASGSSDNSIRIWDLENGAQLDILLGHTGSVESVSFSPDGKHLVSGSSDASVRIWDVIHGSHLVYMEGHDGVVESVVFSPDGTLVASGSADNSVRVWDVTSGEQIAVLRGHDSKVESVAFSPDGQKIFSGSWDNTIRVWQVGSYAELDVLRGHESTIESIACSLDGLRIASASWDNTVRIWDVARGEELGVLRGHGSLVTSVAFSPNGQKVVSGSSDQTIKIWDANSFSEATTLRGHDSAVESVTFSPDGRWIISGSFDDTVRIWDAESAGGLRALKGHEKWIFCLAYSDDGTLLASGSDDGTVRVWDAFNGVQQAVLRGHSSTVECVGFSPDGQMLVSGSFDNTVRIWDVQSWAELKVLSGHKIKVNQVAFSADSREITSRSVDGNVIVWDVATGRSLKNIQDADGASDLDKGSSGEQHYHLGGDGEQTVVTSVEDDRILAYFPLRLAHIATHPNGRSWAGAASNNLYMITLEE